MAEYSAICEAEDQLCTNIEAGDEDYVRNTNPTVRLLHSVIDKCRHARSVEIYRQALYKEAKRMYPDKSPAFLRQVVNQGLRELNI